VRARRAEARKRLRRTEKDLDLLQRHHTKPTYSRVRRVMSQWKADQWSGSYWGSSSRRKKTNKQQAKGKGKGRSANEHAEKAMDHDKELFPSYDRMQVAPSSSSFTSVDGSAEAMQKAMKSLIACNPSLNVPKEVEEALAFQEPLGKAAKDSLYTQQRMLNLRRKATNRVEKLQQALTRKGLQMNAYKEEMKQKLASELERFNKEKQEIMTALEEAKANLAKIESGAEPEMGNEDPGMEVVSDSLAQLLGLQEVDPQEVEQLRAEKMYAEAMASQLHSQVQMMMNAASNGPTPASMDQVFGAGGRMASPQLPGVGPTGAVRPKANERPSPYNKDNRQPNKERREGEVETVLDSPEAEMEQMDR